MDYEILLPEKVRSLTLSEAYKYIEAIQSYPGDWRTTIITIPHQERIDDVEGITPLPTTYGAICFPELYLNELTLREFLRRYLENSEVESVIDALGKGLYLHKVLPSALLEKIDDKLSDFISGVSFEVFIPLEEKVKEPDKLRELGIVDLVEVFKTSVPVVKPEIVRQALEESHYVGEYLEKLEMLFNEAEELELNILRAEGYVNIDITLSDLEDKIQILVEHIQAMKLVIMFTRAIRST